MIRAIARGLQFEKEFGEGLKTVYDFVIKMPDTRSLRMKQHIIERGAGVKFHDVTGMRSPADWWTVHKGVSILWECKQSKGINKAMGFPKANVKDHQLATLKAHKNEGGERYLVINIKNEDINEYYVVDIKDYLMLNMSSERYINREVLNSLSKISLCRLTPTKNPYGDKTIIIREV